MLRTGHSAIYPVRVADVVPVMLLSLTLSHKCEVMNDEKDREIGFRRRRYSNAGDVVRTQDLFMTKKIKPHLHQRNMLLEATCFRQQNCCRFVARLLRDTKGYMLPRYGRYMATCYRQHAACISATCIPLYLAILLLDNYLKICTKTRHYHHLLPP